MLAYIYIIMMSYFLIFPFELTIFMFKAIQYSYDFAYITYGNLSLFQSTERTNKVSQQSLYNDYPLCPSTSSVLFWLPNAYNQRLEGTWAL